MYICCFISKLNILLKKENLLKYMTLKEFGKYKNFMIFVVYCDI